MYALKSEDSQLTLSIYTSEDSDRNTDSRVNYLVNFLQQPYCKKIIRCNAFWSTLSFRQQILLHDIIMHKGTDSQFQLSFFHPNEIRDGLYLTSTTMETNSNVQSNGGEKRSQPEKIRPKQRGRKRKLKQQSNLDTITE